MAAFPHGSAAIYQVSRYHAQACYHALMTHTRSIKGKYVNPFELYDLLRNIATCDSDIKLEGISDHRYLSSLLPFAQTIELEDFRLHFHGALYDIKRKLENIHSREDGGGHTMQATLLRRNGLAVSVGDWRACYTTLSDDSEDGPFGSPDSETRIVDDDVLAQEILGRLASDG